MQGIIDINEAGSSCVLQYFTSKEVSCQHFPKREINGLFEINAVCEILKPDFNTKVAIVKQRADYEKIELSDEIITAIAQKEHNNIRKLINGTNEIISNVKMDGVFSNIKHL